MKKYFVYLDDGNDVLKIAVLAENKADAKKFVEGNGEIIAIKDVTNDYPISADKIHHALKAANFGEIEINFIIRTLSRTDIAE